MTTDTTTPTVRERIAARIAESGRPVSAIARAAGVAQQTLDGLLTRIGPRERPSAEVVTRVCRELGMSPAAIGRMLDECYPKAENNSE